MKDALLVSTNQSKSAQLLLDMSELLVARLAPIHHAYYQGLLEFNSSNIPHIESNFKQDKSSDPALAQPQILDQSQTTLNSGKLDLDKAKTASLWNRQGFTPVPSLVQPEESKIESLEEFDAPFIPIAERIQMGQQHQQEDEREEPDSSIPHSLDEMYTDPLFPEIEREGRPKIGPPPVQLGRHHDPEIHAVLAPMLVHNRPRTPWKLMLLVSLICLVIGGLIAYYFLAELASFM